MDFGLPKERARLKTLPPFGEEVREGRVALTPQGVRELSARGHRVYVERGAGEAAGFPDAAYEEAGARLVSREEAFRRGEVVLKVARPTQEEVALLRPGAAVMAFLHLAVAESALVEAMAAKGLTAIGYELVGNEGKRPVLKAMSEIAGRLAPQLAGRLLEAPTGPGVLLSGLPGIPPADVVILGAGTLGRAAARAFLGAGASVYLLDKDLPALEEAAREAPGAVTALVTQSRLERYVGFADVLVGAVAVPGEKTPVLLSRELLARMRKGAVLLDFAIDQGGIAETSRPGVYQELGITHFCLPNVPALVPRTASHALTATLLPFLLQLEDDPLRVPELRQGAYLLLGQKGGHLE
ncbi:MAG: alanine dehydrogenase [Thermus sp.]|uniref:alanine dehydrogenase n=1 Tax=Thermus sp. TaxID=275 RepID=UPI0025DFBB44|nr:alanine dehydrogenase [Thermus sp.]MCS6868243.1 alanine dehydrogenase [Thermus sp.]MCS7218654.1 alanine dehydrogenase [Thermus sp.]MCX7848600.1 alanine dehydrogenase [Thermus sp.]MDW8017919.1 alanine dehydrogenase [Thermus sp.]MDW8357155.1 alanine dehydrogenase [Thermus sp.]